uniref:Uncharacterized protein n=1 Tax=Onchocerca volvulus TaxID=6282 RepID=A0A8R1XUA0_ONCVO
MGRILDLLENSILTGYCIYRMLFSVHLTAQNIKFISENNISGWIENHQWPELEIAFAIMAIAGLLSGRRFVFSFTVFFFIMRASIAITTVTVDFCTTLMSAVVFLRLFWFIPEANYHRRDLIEQNYVEERQINLPYFIKCAKQKEHGQKHKYDNNYDDNSPYQSSVI